MSQFIFSRGRIYVVSDFYVASGKASVLSRVMQTFIYEKAEAVRVSINVFHTASTIRDYYFSPQNRTIHSFAHL